MKSRFYVTLIPTKYLIIWRAMGYVLYWIITRFLCLLCTYFSCVVLVTIHDLWILNQIKFCSVLFYYMYSIALSSLYWGRRMCCVSTVDWIAISTKKSLKIPKRLIRIEDVNRWTDSTEECQKKKDNKIYKITLHRILRIE